MIRHRERGFTRVSGRRRQGCDQRAVERLGSGRASCQGRTQIGDHRRWPLLVRRRAACCGCHPRFSVALRRNGPLWFRPCGWCQFFVILEKKLQQKIDLLKQTQEVAKPPPFTLFLLPPHTVWLQCAHEVLHANSACYKKSKRALSQGSRLPPSCPHGQMIDFGWTRISCVPSVCLSCTTFRECMWRVMSST